MASTKPAPLSSGPGTHLRLRADADRMPEDIAMALRDMERAGAWDRDRFALAGAAEAQG